MYFLASIEILSCYRFGATYEYVMGKTGANGASGSHTTSESHPRSAKLESTQSEGVWGGMAEA